MQGKKIISPGIVVFDYNIGQTFCGTNSQKNGPKIGSGFPRDDVKNQDDSMAGFKNPCRNIRISVDRSFVRKVSLYQ